MVWECHSACVMMADHHELVGAVSLRCSVPVPTWRFTGKPRTPAKPFEAQRACSPTSWLWVGPHE